MGSHRTVVLGIGLSIFGMPMTQTHCGPRIRADIAVGVPDVNTSGADASTSPRSPSASGLVRSRDVLTFAEIRAAPLPNDASVYDAIQRLRPEFLMRRTVSVRGAAGEAPALRVDDVTFPEMEMLKNIPARTLIEVRYLASLEAQHQLGPQYASGVILVKTSP
jgi:hypothetical protein